MNKASNFMAPSEAKNAKVSKMASTNRDLRRAIGKLRRSLKKARHELCEIDALLQDTCDILSSRDGATRNSESVKKVRRAPNPATGMGNTQAHTEHSAPPIHTGEGASTKTPCLRHVKDHGTTGGPESILSKAQRFKKYWAKYQSLHNEVSKAQGAVAKSERDVLLLMHERLVEMKALISNAGGSEALGSLMGV